MCGTEAYGIQCQFYCNDCHQPMCEQCRDDHQKSPETKKHGLVPYRQRKLHVPAEKCKLHPTRQIHVICRDCSEPLCSRCIFMKEHLGHQFDDLEEKLAEKFVCCQTKIFNIQAYFPSISKSLKLEVQEDCSTVRKKMDDIRYFKKAEAESLQNLVDIAISKKLEEVNTMEESLITKLKSQETTYEDLKNLDTEFHSFLSLSNIKYLVSEEFENFKIKHIPETTIPFLPELTAGQFCEDDIHKLLGNISVPNIEPAMRKIKPMGNASSELKPTGKERKKEGEKPSRKQTLSLSSSVTKVWEFTIPGVDDVYHISLDKSGIRLLWISDIHANLVKTNLALKGNQLQKIQTSGGSEGYHTVTQDGDLIYTDRENDVINRSTPGNTCMIRGFIKTGDWGPLSIHSSHINGDLLVGMINEIGQSKVTRYNKTGTEIQNMQRDNKGQKLYKYPHYITENINGTICVSDYMICAVVVIDKSGQYRFSYTGQGSELYPYGVCTDVLGHIIICDAQRDTVHLLDQDGQFLSLLLTSQPGVWSPRSVCVDDKNNLLVGQRFTNTVRMYKYLHG